MLAHWSPLECGKTGGSLVEARLCATHVQIFYLRILCQEIIERIFMGIYSHKLTLLLVRKAFLKNYSSSFNVF